MISYLASDNRICIDNLLLMPKKERLSKMNENEIILKITELILKSKTSNLLGDLIKVGIPSLVAIWSLGIPDVHQQGISSI